MTKSEIRAYLADRYNVGIECVIAGDEGTEDTAGLYLGEADAWLVYETMPNTNEAGWFFAGYSAEVIHEASGYTRRGDAWTKS
jgi:hypothetical protein